MRAKRILAGFAWTTAAVLVVGLLGLQVLWVNNADWGSGEDILVALLWGLGLYTGTAVSTTAAANRFSQVPGGS